MFDIFAKLLSSIVSFLFPLFASYKALKTSDPAQLTPWLMYWVVLACALLVESWAEWFLCWVPFYAYIRLIFLLYLILPQTQGARVIYQEYIHPYLQDNEHHIDDFIASAHDRAKAMGIMYLRQLIEYVKVNVLGMAPSRVDEQQQQQHAQGYGGQQSSVTQNLLARFSLPSARWSGESASGNLGANDFYGLLAGAMGAAMGAAGGARDKDGTGRAPSVIPSHVNEADKASFIATQRERLTTLLAALDREAANVQSGSAVTTPMPSTATSSQPFFRVREVVESLGGGGGGDKGLTKSRSEADFEKIEAMSGTEEGSGDEDGSVRRRAQGAAGGSWMPWGWGGASPSAGVGDAANLDEPSVAHSSSVDTNAGQ